MSIDGDDDLEDGSVLLDDSIQAFYGHSSKLNCFNPILFIFCLDEPVYTCTLSPSQPTVACTGGGDDAAYLWNVENGEKLVELPRHKDSVIAAGFSHDGRYIATGGMDGVVNVSVVPGKARREFNVRNLTN
jgi:WD40 repeat protein